MKAPIRILLVLSILFLLQIPKSAFAYELGINFLWNSGDISKLESSFQRMQEMGIKTARTDFEWRAVENVKGTYDWRRVDKLVELAHSYNIKLLPIVHYAPKWTLKTSAKKPSDISEFALHPDFHDEYADFLNAAIDRYGPGGNATIEFTPITDWQIWNEPNNKVFWYMVSGGEDSWDMSVAAEQFAVFMKTVTSKLGERRNKINVVHAGLSTPDIEYIWSLWKKDSSYGQRFDIMALHSYFFNPTGGVRPVDAMDENDPEYSKLGFIGSKNDNSFLAKIYNIKRFMELKNSLKPIWVTEVGFMGNESGPVAQNPWVIKDAEVASLTKDTLKYLKDNQQILGVHKVYWFVLDDYNFPYDMGNFGVYRSDGTKRANMPGIIDSYTP